MDNFVLVIDDNVENLKVLGNILKENGYRIALVQSGKEAFSICETMLPKVIFLDVMMPDMDGYEVLKILKSKDDTRDIPIIMVTAKSEADDVDEALLLGAVDYIKKPINKIELLARLRTSMKLREKELNLQEMLRSKEEFIQLVAHDLRTPFASISGFADILINDAALNSKMNSEHKEYLNLIIDTTAFLVDYFNKLLNWASIEAKELQINRSPVNLKSIVQAAGLMYSSKLMEKNHVFINDVKEDNIIEADPSFFQQVVNNILGNAIKFTPDNGEIIVFSHINNSYIELIFRDSGVGTGNMTPEELFSKSFHKSTRGTKGEKGTGVGLRICKLIAAAHAFGLTFRPAPSKGTDFIISIPLMR